MNSVTGILFIKVFTVFAPSTFTPETTTVWSFPDRGDWATHVGNYRGNCRPTSPATSSCATPRPATWCLTRWLAPGLLPWNASSWDGAPWLWISIPMLSWWRATGWISRMRRWMLSIKYRKSGHTWATRAPSI